MNMYSRSAACVAAGFLLLPALHAQIPGPAAAAQTLGSMPGEFKDPDTGARILLLSKNPGTPSGVIYFTQDCITPDSRYALVRDLDPAAGHTAGLMYRYDFKTGEVVKLTDLMTKNQVMVSKSGNLYFTSDNDRAIYVTNILDLKTRKVADMPAEIICSGGLTVNSDETMVVGTGTLAAEHKNEPILTTAPNQGAAFTDTFARHDTNLLIAADIKTGKFTELHRINTWLGHTQFSPTDPTLLLFCHEGPWDQVDRMWTLRIDHPVPQNILKRTEVNEIAGHEFWATDGSAIWYDHNFRNTPTKHYLEGKNLTTGAITRYPITPPFGSIHYTQSPDGKFFVCDGGTVRGNPEQQAMYILVPDNGKLNPIKLCSMAKNNYTAAEPNPHLTPDQHWALFTATFSGISQAYAVEMPKQFWR
jgi:oligogalacturonide lyase